MVERISQDKYQETITSVIYNTPNDTGMGKVTSNAAWEVHHISQMHTVDRKVFIGTINNMKGTMRVALVAGPG